MARLIRSTGLDVETFPSAGAFMQRKVLDRPACLLLDVRLAGSSGLDLQSDLGEAQRGLPIIFITGFGDVPMSVRAMKGGDRKSTRLNSSHSQISYAVFCLKKKK